MVIFVVSNCPPSIRGILSRWLFEINSGIFVGNINVKVRESLWQYLQENLRDGTATMVFPEKNEQNLDFRICNSKWTPTDLDGVKIMKLPHRSQSQFNEEILSYLLIEPMLSSNKTLAYEVTYMYDNEIIDIKQISEFTSNDSFDWSIMTQEKIAIIGFGIFRIIHQFIHMIPSNKKVIFFDLQKMCKVRNIPSDTIIDALKYFLPFENDTVNRLPQKTFKLWKQLNENEIF